MTRPRESAPRHTVGWLGCRNDTGAVNVDNFVRAETDRMFADLQRDAEESIRSCTIESPLQSKIKP